MKTRVVSTLLALVLLAIALAPAGAWGHGYMVQPTCRAIASPDRDYQWCPTPPGCECGDFPDAGPIVATFEAGQTIQVTLTITKSHPAGDFFHFQLCEPASISEACFEEGTIASFENDGTTGTKVFEFQIPPGTQCDPCVLRWKWDYAFLSCADVSIEASSAPAAQSSWSTVKAGWY